MMKKNHKKGNKMVLGKAVPTPSFGFYGDGEVLGLSRTPCNYHCRFAESVPRVSLLPVPSLSLQGKGRRETLGTRLRFVFAGV